MESFPLNADPVAEQTLTFQESLRGNEIIANYLLAERVPYVFALCGHGNIGMLDAFYDCADRIKVVSVHHEAIAGFMADGYFRVAHRPVATLTSCGPGSLNLPIALASAMMDSSAFLALTGNVPTSQFNRGPFQETYRFFQADAAQAFRPYVKRSFQAPRPEMLPIILRQAFKTMLTGRYGPVHVDVPLNVFMETTSETVPQPELWYQRSSSRTSANPSRVEDALSLLLEAERPLILAGHGVVLSEGTAELRELAKHLQIPVINTPNGKGAFDMEDRLSLGDVGRNGTFAANSAARSCDVLLAVGCRFDDRVSSAWLPGYSFTIPPTQLIQIDIDPEELGRNFPVSVGLLGDARTVLRQMLERMSTLDAPRIDRYPWLEQIAHWNAEWEDYHRPLYRSDSVPIRPERVVTELRAALPREGILLADVGVHHNWLVQGWRTSLPQTVLQSWGFASMGFAVGGALGAKLAAPDRPVVAVCGDGGFLMFPSAVATAVEYDIPVTWVIWNNLGYCSIRDMQLAHWPGRELATSFVHEVSGELHDSNLADMARAMGAQAVRIAHPDQLGDALRSAITSGVPSVIEVLVDREIHPPAVGSWVLPPLPPARPTFPSNGQTGNADTQGT